MNNVVLYGRMVRDPEIRYSQGENANASARFTIAVQRDFKNKDGQYDADFVSCVAFSKSAEFLEKYFKKGDLIGVRGAIRTGSYTNKEGATVYTTDVIVDKIEFGGSKNASSEGCSTPATPTGADLGFNNIPDGVEELPFN